jgi:hypothetical protein
MYTVATDKWEQLPPLEQAKGASSVSLLKNRWLYSIGGYNSTKETNNPGN